MSFLKDKKVCWFNPTGNNIVRKNHVKSHCALANAHYIDSIEKADVVITDCYQYVIFSEKTIPENMKSSSWKMTQHNLIKKHRKYILGYNDKYNHNLLEAEQCENVKALNKFLTHSGDSLQLNQSLFLNTNGYFRRIRNGQIRPFNKKAENILLQKLNGNEKYLSSLLKSIIKKVILSKETLCELAKFYVLEPYAVEEVFRFSGYKLPKTKLAKAVYEAQYEKFMNKEQTDFDFKLVL